MTRQASSYPHTPDGRYFVVKGRLWRCSKPGLDPQVRDALVLRLMNARRLLRRGVSVSAVDRAVQRAEVEAVKSALGERGPAWWSDGTPDWNRHLVKNTPYAAWHAALERLEP